MLEVELHFHSDESRYDSADSIEKMIKRGKELGAKKFAVTEHGVLTGIDTFVHVCQNEGVEPVPAMEAYIKLEENSPEGRCHACLFAKDDIGYQAIGEASTDSFRNMERDFPIINRKILETYFGKDGYGHGHVILSTACISGVLARILNQNQYVNKEIAKIDARLEKIGYIPVDIHQLEKLDAQIEAVTADIDALKPLANKKFGRERLRLEKLTGEEHMEALAALKAKEAEQKEAFDLLAKKKEEKAALKKARTAENKKVRDFKKAEEKAKDLLEKKRNLKSSLFSDRELYQKAKERALYYQNLFGKENFYIELQYHGMPEEAKTFPQLAQLAKELNIPIVATNDAHMAFPGEKSVRARQIMRSIRYIKNKNKAGNRWQEAGVADSELYIKTEEELAESLLQILDEDTVKRAIAGRKELLDKCHLTFEKKDHYPKFVSEIAGEDSAACLRRKTYEGAKKRFPHGLTSEYQERIEMELDVMCRMGYADYHLIVQDYIAYGKLIGKLTKEELQSDWFKENRFHMDVLQEKTKNSLGVGVGPGRGSAAGSEVCYCLGITNIDPIPYGLLFQRFLNPERVSMPDIDCDFATYIRDYVFDYVSYKYGAENVCHIMTRNTQQAKKAIDSCAKLLGDKEKGSTTVYQDKANTIKKMVEDNKLPEREVVVSKFGNDKTLIQIYDDACLVTNTFTGYGMHAAGVVISDGIPVKKHVPLMFDTDKKVFKTQCDMVQAEEDHRLLKMDFLGLMNLDILTDTLRLVEKRHGVMIDLDHIPFEKEVFEHIYCKGFTNGVFQTESQGMKQMMRQANPKTIEDVIILISMYRPGPMDFLPALIDVMNGKKEAEYLCPELEPILGKTYGAIVYQEQVMQIFQELAGYSLGGADLVRRAMSKKKQSVLAKEETTFVKGCTERGISDKVAKKLFAQMSEFAKYAFNKSHAAAYATVSYQTAYLKHHYPEEYLCVCMNYFIPEKRKGLIEDAKSLKIPVLQPDINQSSIEFSIQKGEIHYGLQYILNVGFEIAKNVVKERKENGRFTSFYDFVYRTGIKGQGLRNMIACGCFDKISTKSRKSLLALCELEEFEKIVKTISDKKKLVLDETLSERRLDNAKKALETAKQSLELLSVPVEESSRLEELLMEYEYMGIMLSGHPTDEYPAPQEIGCYELSDLYEGYGSVMGFVLDMKIIVKRKKMAFFSLDMPNGQIRVCCFDYDKWSGVLKENAVVRIYGQISKEEWGDEEFFQIIVKEAKPLFPQKKDIVVYGYCQSKEEWQEFGDALKTFQVKDGFPLILYNGNLNRFQNTKMIVDKRILEDPRFHAEFR